MTFKAIRVDKTEAGQIVGFVEMEASELMDGDVTVRVTHSTVNYKDGLALSGKSTIPRKFPLVLGIDFAGIVESSAHEGFRAGDSVFVNGFGLGETHFGGYSQLARVKGDWLLKVPEGWSGAEVMAVGTAGFTAALCLDAIEAAGVAPAMGPAIVTGAVGGVGSVAIALLAKAGWSVIASTGRPSEGGYLESLGATEIIERASLSGPAKLLGKERWAAGVDSVGSYTLANVLSQTRYGGAIAACGLAGGMDLPTSVAPFILRGVKLLGIDSVQCPLAPRRLGADRARSRPRQARGNDDDRTVRAIVRDRRRYSRRQGARPRRHRDRVRHAGRGQS